MCFMHVLNFLKENRKIKNAGGRGRTPDLKPSNALTPAWLPLGHLFFVVCNINKKYYKINKRNTQILARIFKRANDGWPRIRLLPLSVGKSFKLLPTDVCP